jgi:hypothetical protein
MQRDEAQITEIGHVLFLDIVGYSKEPTSAQSRLVQILTSAVEGTDTFQATRKSDEVLPIATGDGMALVFFKNVVSPAQCALEVTKALQGALKLRIGIHSGLVSHQRDIAGNPNVAGEGINTAQRVMDLGEDGHILMSSQYAAWLGDFEDWRPHIRELGHGTGKHGLKLAVYGLSGPGFGREDAPNRISATAAATLGIQALRPMNLVVLYKRHAQPDEQLLRTLESRFQQIGHQVFIDRHLKIGVEWAKAIEEKIRSADAVIAILSDSSLGSEMLEYELETAHDEMVKRGRPYLLPVRVGSEQKIEGSVGSIINHLNYSVWNSPQDDSRVFAELLSALAEPLGPKDEPAQLEPVGGAISPDSPFYVERSADAECLRAIEQAESIILIKGPRQVGKTSLLGRAAKYAKDSGLRSATTDFQKLSTSQLSSEENFYKLLAATLARQFNFTYDFGEEWMDVFGPNMNMDNFLRGLLESSDEKMIWFMDEADKLFGVPFASDFFGLVRSWHNSRATEPGGPWRRFTVVISYATEAHLFIQDLNQSPFNVGRQLSLQSFTLDQVSNLNMRYGSPLKPSEVSVLFGLIGGQPFMVRRALDVLARKSMDFETMMGQADRDDGPFGDHLKRILISVSQLPTVLEAMKASLQNPELLDSDGFHRLLSSGVVRQTANNQIEITSELYRRYLQSRLREG